MMKVSVVGGMVDEASLSKGRRKELIFSHWQFQTRASPGIAQINSDQLWLLLMEARSSSAARVACLGNLSVLKPPMYLASHFSFPQAFLN